MRTCGRRGKGVPAAGALEEPRAGRAAERDVRADDQVVEEPRVAARPAGVEQARAGGKLDDASTRGPGRVNGLLDGRGIVRLAVAHGPEVRDAECRDPARRLSGRTRGRRITPGARSWQKAGGEAGHDEEVQRRFHLVFFLRRMNRSEPGLLLRRSAKRGAASLLGRVGA